MLITKEQQEALIAKYNKEGHSQDECLGFIDGMGKLMELIIRLDKPREFPVLLKRCLVFGVTILPHQLDSILKQYELKKIPNDDLSKLSGEDLKNYTHGLYLCNQEMSRDWTKGHDILKGLGFEEKKRLEGGRSFVSLVFNKKYCMPDGINSKEEHEEYLRVIGINKENISLSEYVETVNKILAKQHGWENTPSHQIVEIDYNQGKSIKDCVECFTS